MPTRIEQLASSDTLYYRGDTCMEIAPFDNYYAFTIYKESGDNTVDESVPLNLTNLGDLYISFGDIRIKQYDNVDNVDTANGEVIFRISKDTARQIIAMSDHTFYISAQITDGATAGDETVLYTGEWMEFSVNMRSSLTETITTLNTRLSDLQRQYTGTTAQLNAQIEERDQTIASLTESLAAAQAAIDALQMQVDAYEDRNVGYINANILSTEYINSTTQDSTFGISTVSIPKKVSKETLTTKSKEEKASSLSMAFRK